jgi:hypothetical protein
VEVYRREFKVESGEQSGANAEVRIALRFGQREKRINAEGTKRGRKGHRDGDFEMRDGAE